MFARLIFCLLLVMPNAALARDVQSRTWSPATVSLEIRNPDGTAKSFPDVPWSLGITVLDTLKMVDGIKFSGEWNRSLSDWLITTIDGTAMANGSYWTYCVNGEAAGVGAGSYSLGPSASIVWVYSSAYPPDCK